MACVRQFQKKIVCDPYVTLVFLSKISPHTTLRMTMCLVFEKTNVNILKLFIWMHNRSIAMLI